MQDGLTITLKDIKLIAITFNRILRGMQHDRIKYQQLNDFEDKNRIKLSPSKEEKLEKRIQKKKKKKNSDFIDNVPSDISEDMKDIIKEDGEN